MVINIECSIKYRAILQLSALSKIYGLIYNS